MSKKHKNPFANIEERLIPQIKERYEDEFLFDVDVPFEDACSYFSKRTSYGTFMYNGERLNMQREQHINKEDLFDKPISEVIKFLNTLDKTLVLRELWSGYEDNYLVLTHDEVESDDEYCKRVADTLYEIACNVLRPRQNEILKRKQEIVRLEKELAHLKKLG